MLVNTAACTLMSPEQLDGLCRQFQRDGYVVIEDALSPVQLHDVRAECDAVTARYAEIAGVNQSPEGLHDDDDENTDDVPDQHEHADDICTSQWLSDTFGCILEVPGCCECCGCVDATRGGYRAKSCAVTGSSALQINEMLRPNGVFGEIATALLGTFFDDQLPIQKQTPPHLFNDQYIVKPKTSHTARFAWHWDSQWCDGDSEVENTETEKTKKRKRNYDDTTPNYISLWTALDDVDAKNGCIRVLPYPGRTGDTEKKESNTSQSSKHAPRYKHGPSKLNVFATRQWSKSISKPDQQFAINALNDMKTLKMSAGSILAMSNKVLHCSGPNASTKKRRAWMPQFSAGPVFKNDDEKKTVALAVPLSKI